MSALEPRLRRWLALYPYEQREEMLGVLLASADPQQKRPGVRDTFDLVRGAIKIRGRRELASLGGDVWRDAFAVLSGSAEPSRRCPEDMRDRCESVRSGPGRLPWAEGGAHGLDRGGGVAGHQFHLAGCLVEEHFGAADDRAAAGQYGFGGRGRPGSVDDVEKGVAG